MPEREQPPEGKQSVAAPKLTTSCTYSTVLATYSDYFGSDENHQLQQTVGGETSKLPKLTKPTSSAEAAPQLQPELPDCLGNKYAGGKFLDIAFQTLFTHKKRTLTSKVV
jgi:hypothetical protein